MHLLGCLRFHYLNSSLFLPSQKREGRYVVMAKKRKKNRRKRKKNREREVELNPLDMCKHSVLAVLHIYISSCVKKQTKIHSKHFTDM